MSLDCIRQANECALSDPCVAGLLATTQVTIRVREWEGRVGAGTYSDTDLVLPMQYPMKEIRNAEIASSGGRFLKGDVRFSEITKPFTGGAGGGYSADQLNPQRTFGVNDDHLEELYILTGDTEGVFALVDLEDVDTVTWALVLRRTRRAA